MGLSLSPGGLIEVSAAGVLANEQIDGLFVRAVSEQNLGLEEATASDLQSLLQLVRKKIDGVSELFTLDACRHGGMTELEEAELTDGQGRALPGTRPRRPIAVTPRKRCSERWPQLGSDMRICWRRNDSNNQATVQLQFKIKLPAMVWRAGTPHNASEFHLAEPLFATVPSSTRTDRVLRARTSLISNH